MSSGDMQGSEGALGNKTDALQQRANGLIAAIHGSKTTRRMIFLLLLIGIGAYGYWLYNTGKELTSQKSMDKFMAELEARQEKIQKNIMKEIDALAKKKGDVVKQAFIDQFNKDAPIYSQILEKQRDEIVKSLQARFEKEMDQHYRDVMKKQEDFIAKELDIKGDDLKMVMGHMQEAMARAVKKYKLERFEAELKLLDKQWQEFPAAEGKPQQGETEASELVGIFMEILARKLREDVRTTKS